MQTAMKTIADILGPVLEALIGPQYAYGEYFFIKGLLLLLLFVMIKTAASAVPMFKENKKVALVIAAVVSIMAVRFMPERLIENWIQSTYGILGVALLTLLPLIIYFFFVHKSIASATGRKAGWILYLVVMGAIFFNKYPQLDDLSKYLFWGTIIAAIALIIFDNQVRKYFGLMKIEEFLGKSRRDRLLELQREYKAIEDLNTKEAEEKRGELIAEMKKLGGDIGTKAAL
jgi:hypothetical protein